MNKLNQLALALSVITFASCSKHVDATVTPVDAITVPAPTPGPHVNPTPTPTAVKWSGTGTLQTAGMPDAGCATVNVEILDDANGFELQKFSYDCSGQSSTVDTIRLANRAGELYQGTDKVGTKHDNTVQFELHDPSGATIGFKFVNANDSLQATQTLSANGFQQTLNATLKRQ
jgi:hypothetical protein